MSFRSLWIGTLAAVAAFGAVTTANSAIIPIGPGGTAVINSSNDVAKATAVNVTVAPMAGFTHVYTLDNQIGVPTSITFSVASFDPAVFGGIGIADLNFNFNGIDTAITDSNGVQNAPIGNSPTIYTLAFANGPTVLTVTGTALADTNYDFAAAVVPLPPALLLFGTALGGMGWLSRRRKDKATA